MTSAGWDCGDARAATVAAAGSPVRIGPETLARAALLTCAHYVPIGRSRDLLQALSGIDVSTGFLAGIRGRAARRLEKQFLPHLRGLLAGAPVRRCAGATRRRDPGRASGTLSYVHVACTEYLTLLHVGDRSAATIAGPRHCVTDVDVRADDTYQLVIGAQFAPGDSHGQPHHPAKITGVPRPMAATVRPHGRGEEAQQPSPRGA